MAPASRRTDFTGPALVRLLASLTQADVPGSRQVFAERLSQWVGWTDAITLSAALSSSAGKRPVSTTAPTTASTTAPAVQGASAEEADAQRVRATLVKALADDSDWSDKPTARSPRGRHAMQPMSPAAAPADARTNNRTDYTPYRWHYLARQQTMDTGLTPLRERLRQALTARSPALASLAALDAAMERVLGAQERSLLATVPTLLESHFVRQRDAAGDGWLQRFQQDMHSVLRAELELRFLPIDGLLAALRPSPQSTHQPARQPA